MGNVVLDLTESAAAAGQKRPGNGSLHRMRRALGVAARPLHALRQFAGSALFMRPGDIPLFLRSRRTDAAVARLRAGVGARTAFETVYRDCADPWASASRRYHYQHRKYRTLVAFLPEQRRYARALDLGCGLGVLTRLLAGRSDSVLGLDVAQAAVDRAATAHADIGNIRFAQGDVLDLPAELDGCFDIVTIADMLYYLSPMSDELLKLVALRVAALLAPSGICLLGNHFFFGHDRDSRLSQRIHRAFAWSPQFHVVCEHWRPFYLVSVLGVAPIRTPAETAAAASWRR